MNCLQAMFENSCRKPLGHRTESVSIRAAFASPK
jgi:hypothetical protein